MSDVHIQMVEEIEEILWKYKDLLELETRDEAYDLAESLIIYGTEWKESHLDA